MALLPIHQLQHLIVVGPCYGGALAQVELVSSVSPSVVVKRSSTVSSVEDRVYMPDSGNATTTAW
jgi:hypothetical protein